MTNEEQAAHDTQVRWTAQAERKRGHQLAWTVGILVFAIVSMIHFATKG